MKINSILPTWPAPTWIRAMTTTCAHKNLATHVQDNPAHVALNRLKLRQYCNWQNEPFWLDQIHSTHVVIGEQQIQAPIIADGVITQAIDTPCAVLTADCLPILLCNSQGSWVGALHCGWKGLLNGIIENAIGLIPTSQRKDILVWLGPAIGPRFFEVGEDVRQPFIQKNRAASAAFTPSSSNQPGKWMADIYKLAKLRLNALGIYHIYGGDYCTYEDPRFYSYRRDKITGRMASCIWITPH